jgi:small-conductance mechanosensitive channel
MALGFEASAGGWGLTLGWSRTWARRRASGATTLSLDNPFSAGDRLVPVGVYDGSIDQVGIMIDAELDAPD